MAFPHFLRKYKYVHKAPGRVDIYIGSRDETAAPTPRIVVPDGCNVGVFVRVGIAVNAGALVGAAIVAGSWPALLPVFLGLAGIVEPTFLVSLLLWCLLRRSLPPLSAAAQRPIAWAMPVLAVVMVVPILNATAQGALQPPTPGMLLGALTAGVVIQHYLELRARAYSPVLAEAKYQALQSRIRPHFFFNSLNAAVSIVRTDPARAERMLESIAELIRAVMGDVRRLVPFEQELDLCRKYVEIEQTRLGDRLTVDWQIGAIHPRAEVPQLLLQPLIENAVRYGAEKLAGKCEIVVQVRQRGFNLDVFVSNPVARDPIQREGNQIGLTNIRGRLALIYDLEARLETRVRNDRFELNLTIPVEQK